MKFENKDNNKANGSKARKIGVAVGFIIATLAVAAAIVVPTVISCKR